MAKVTELREELRFNKEIASIINVLKAVAASEFSRLQRERRKFDEFDKYLQSFFEMVDVEGFSDAFVEDSKLPSNIILITSDVGFLGELNITVVNTVFKEYKKDDCLTLVGIQGLRYLEGITENIEYFPGISDYISFREIEKLRDYVIKLVKDGHVGRTLIVYPHFISFAVQEIAIFQLFPCRQLFKPPQQVRKYEQLIVEPSIGKIVESLIRIWTGNVMYHIFWESKLSEWSARIIHLETSSDELARQAKLARAKYFRAIHENSDKSIREIFASSMAGGRVGISF